MADLYYIEEGYYNPSLGYFVYTADAAAATTSSATMSITVGVVKSTAVSTSSAFTQTTTADKLISASASALGQFTQSVNAGKILNAVIDCGALFSPGITATAFKNHTAILDVVFTVNTVGSANRSTSIATDTIANLNAQAAKIADVNSSFTSTATQSAQVSKFLDTSSALQTQSTLAVDALSVQLAAATLSSTASIAVQAKLGTERPLTVHSYSGAQINTTTKKFGAASLEVSNNSYLKYYADEYTIPQPYETNGPREELVIEFWYRPNSVDGEPILQYTNGSTVYWQVLDNGGFQYLNTSNATITKSPTVSPTTGQFNHLLIAMTANGNFSIFVNGTRRHNSTATTEFKDNTAGTGLLEIGKSTGGANGYVDELRVITGPSGTVLALGYDITQTTITQPSGQFANTTTTRFLGHYDVDFRDDVATLVSPSPALTSQFTLTASAQELSSGQASLATAASLSALVSANRSADAALSAAATQTATATRIQEAASALSSEFAIDPKGHVKRNIVDADLPPAVFTQSTDADRIRTAAIAITSAFTPTLTADAFKNMVAVLDAVATLSAQATTNVNVASALTSTATLSSDLTRIRTVDTAISAASSLAATVFRTQDNQAAITASAALSVVAGQEVDAQGAFTSTSTQSATVAKTAAGVASLSSAFIQTTAGERTRSTAVSLTSACTLSLTAVKINPGSAAITATASLSATAVKTTEIVVSASAVFTQSTLVNRTVNPELTFNSIATQLSVAYQNASGTVLLESVSTLSAIIGSIKQGIPERAITGIRFNNDTDTDLGDTVILLAHRNSPPAGPNLSNNWAVAFWAYSPEGVVLTHNPTTFNAASGYMKFDNGSFELRSPSPNNDYRSATWTGLTTTGWHHYLIYQQLSDPDPVVKLYQDGVLKSSPSIFSYDDGTSPSPPTDDLLAVWYDPRFLFTDLNWCVGALVQHLERTPTAPGNGVAAYQLEPMQGVLSQFVSYWTSVPAFTDTATRQQLYNNGYVDLGNMGTSSGLARPNIYLRLQNYRDVDQLGSVAFDIPSSVRWLELTDLDSVPPSQSTVHYRIANDHEGTTADNFGNGFLAIADLECAVSGVFLFELPISAEFSASILGLRVRTSTAAFTSTSTLSALATKQASAAASLNAQSTLGSVNPTRFRPGSAAFTAESTVFVEEGELLVGFAALASAFTFAATTTIIVPIQGDANLTSTCTLAVSALRVKSVLADLTATATITADATLIPPVRAEANLTATATLTAIIGGRFELAALEVAAATLTVNAVVSASGRAAITATATQSTQPTKRTGIPLTNLQVAGFQLTAGDIINFEPSLTYVVPEETRELMILGESREYIIEQETRLLTLLEG